METRVPVGLSASEGRQFGLLVGGVLVLLAGIAFWRGHGAAAAVVWVVGGALLAAGVLVPGKLGPVYRGWMRFGLMLSKVTTPIVMGVIYVVVFTPIGYVRRSLGWNALVRRRSDTFWIDREPIASRRSDLNRQF